MDCNNYSYCNTRGKSNIIAETETGLSGWPVCFEYCVNWFGDHFYSVSDLFGACETFEFSSLDYEAQKTAYKSAARFYNSLVHDADMIPLF